jgi:hypothetical protein
MLETARKGLGVGAIALVAADCGEFGGSSPASRVDPLARSSEQRLEASDSAEFDQFGWSVSLAGDRALVGAYGDDAYRGRDGPVETVGLAPVARDELLVGAHYDDNLRGAGYIFSLPLANGASCTTDADCASGHCADHRCCDVDCTGACGVCSLAEGAVADGICTLFPAGFEGRPPCGSLVCNGRSPQCALCDSEEECPEVHYCAADQTCRPKWEQGDASAPRGGGCWCHMAGAPQSAPEPWLGVVLGILFLGRTCVGRASFFDRSGRMGSGPRSRGVGAKP